MELVPVIFIGVGILFSIAITLFIIKKREPAIWNALTKNIREELLGYKEFFKSKPKKQEALSKQKPVEVAVKYCPACGVEAQSGDSYCSNCSAKLRKVPALTQKQRNEQALGRIVLVIICIIIMYFALRYAYNTLLSLPDLEFVISSKPIP